jgi:PAS domain S-box-containing protein
MATILVVDDQPPIRHLLAAFLSSKGHCILEAGDGAEALALVRTHHPDLVITDILMPSMDGYEFVRQLRSDPAIAGTPVIFYSAIYHQMEAQALARACGVPHIITKPADLDVIHETVEAALAERPTLVPAPAEEFDREHVRLLTDRVAQENARLNRIVETIADGILFFDLEGRITFANSTAERFIGLSRQEICRRTHQNWALQITASDGQPVATEETFFARVKRTRAPVQGEERCLLRPDGSRIVVSCNAAPISDVTGALTGVLGSFTDITDRKRAEEARRRYTERLQSLSQQLMKAQEVERRHIARELHDEIGQALTAVKINLQAILRNPDTEKLSTRLEESISTVERTLNQVRNLSLDLRPSILDDLGLVAALRWYLDRQAERAGFAAQFTAEAFEEPLTPELEITCFRIVQEALTNVIRHARARHVYVSLECQHQQVCLSVEDDGIGFDKTAARDRAVQGASLGLLGMQERVALLGGRFDLDSTPMQGTRIRVRLPLASCPEPARQPQGR